MNELATLFTILMATKAKGCSRTGIVQASCNVVCAIAPRYAGQDHLASRETCGFHSLVDGVGDLQAYRWLGREVFDRRCCFQVKMEQSLNVCVGGG
ncbi:MAG: hypothetical protein Q7N50_03620, partial [Armatimonadota bacterium]|nr:hypothetical protein [Armatimonadota bacterium]